MPTLSNRVGSLQESAIRKLDFVVRRQQGVKFHRLNIGQPDVPTPQPLLEAIAAFHPPVLAYGPAGGTPECREAAAAYHARWSPGLGPMDVSVTAGGSEALLFAFTAICDPGDDVVVPEPYYTNYNGFATVAGARVRPIRTSIADGFRLPPDDVLDAALSPRTRAVVFANPGNPTGAVYGREELARLLAWAARHDLFVIADEVYRRIWFDAPPTSAMEFEEHRERVVAVDSVSKTYSACGLRVGFLISRNAALMEKVERIAQARLGVQPLAQHVAIRALTLPEAHYEETRQVYKERVSAMVDALRALPGVNAPRPAGAFYSMVGLPIDDAEAFARWMVEEFRSEGESVVVAPGPGFYANPADGRNEIRLAAVNDVATLRRGVELLGRGVEAFQRRAR
jgi:aspartate aminotransferase